MTDVETFHKPAPEPCVCDCGQVGRPRAKAWKDGLGPHVKTCRCRRCLAPTYRRNAAARERRLAKKIGGERQPLSGALSGADVTGVLDIEETASKAITRGFESWINGKGVSLKRARLMQRRTLAPKVLVLALKPSWSVMPTADLLRLAEAHAAALEELAELRGKAS